MKYLFLIFFSLSVYADSVRLGSGNALYFHGRPIATTAPTNGQVLSWVSATGKWTPSSAGAGDVSGPASSTDNAIAVWDGTGGDTLQDSSVTVAAGVVTATTFVGALTGTASGNLQATANQYGLLASGAANTATVIAPVSGTTKVLTSGGTGANPTWSSTMNPVQFLETVVAGGTCSTSYNVNPTNGSMINLTLSGACEIGVTSLAAGHSFTIKLTQSSTTTPTFTAAYKWPSATAPSWSASATKYDIIACASFDGSTLQCNGIVDVR